MSTETTTKPAAEEPPAEEPAAAVDAGAGTTAAAVTGENHASLDAALATQQGQQSPQQTPQQPKAASGPAPAFWAAWLGTVAPRVGWPALPEVAPAPRAA